MMKKLAVLFMIFTALNVYADDNIDLEFTGTLAAPTCSASFESTNGTDIHFDTIHAGDFMDSQNGDVITTGTPVSAFIRLSGCGSNVANLIMDFTGAVSGYGFQGKSVYLKSSAGANTMLGVALFKDSTAQTRDEAISFDAGTKETVPLSSLIIDGADYKFPLYARIILANAQNGFYDSIGDLTATAQVAVTYE